MKKSDLKSGMRVELADGRIFILVDGIFSDGDMFFRIGDVDENFNRSSVRSKIVAIYARPVHSWEVLNPNEKGGLLWKREETKELTVAEVSKLLGYKVKIIE